ncbi:hypothetical protein Tco_0739796 [Tanacetum coccineum]
MSSITAQQTKLDLELVPKENRLDIGKCNRRIPRGVTPREPTFQVVLDTIVLTPCYPAILIIVDVPEVSMHEFWNSVYKHDIFYRFKLDKKKRFKLTLEVFRDIFQIFPRVQGRDFDPLPFEEDTVSFLRELGHTGEINSLNDVVVDQMHQPWRTFAALINRGLSGKTSGLDKLRLSKAQILWGMFYQKNVNYVELLWEDFIYQIDNRAFKKQEKMYYPRFTIVIIHHFLIQDKTLSWRNKIGMHTSKDDYLINSLRFVSAKESTQIYGAILPECLTSPAMKESKAYKTYLGYATGAVPPKMAQKFKKASPSKKDSDLVPVDKEPVQKGKRVKRPAKKSTTKPAAGVVIREALVETKSKSKEKEKVDVTRGKGIELLSEVALTEEAQMKEVRKKSLRDFHKTHPSGFGTVAEKPQSVDKITPIVTSEGTGDKLGVPDVTEDDSTEMKDDDQEEEEFVHTPTDDKDDDNLESESDDVIKSDEEKGIDDTTYQFDDDVDARLKEPTQTNKEVVQGEGADAEMNDAQQENENLETTQEQVVEDAHVTISTVTMKTEVHVTSSSRSSNLASKFLNFSDIPHAYAEIVSPLDVHVHHEVPRTQAPTLLTIPVSVIIESSHVYTNIPQSSQTFTPPPILTTPNPPSTIKTINPLSTLPDFASVFRFNDRITTLEKEVAELEKDPLHTQVTTLVDEHLDTQLGETREEFMKFLLESLTTRIKEQLIKESRDKVTLAKVSSQPHSTYEAASTLTEFELKKILIDKMEKSESYLAAPEHRDCYDSLKKSYNLDKDFFFSYDVYSLKHGRKDKDKDEDPFAGSDRGLKKRKTSKDAEPTTCPKNKDSTSSSSKGTKSQPKPSGKSVQSEEPVFEVADSDMPQDQEGNPGDNDDEPRKEDASRCDWFKKPTPPQEPTDPDWHEGKTPQKGPTQKWLMTLAASTSTDKSLKDFDELMSTPKDFSGYILNGLKMNNLTQEILLGPAFRLLKGTRSNYVELEYNFKECYKALSEKLDWENPEGGNYPFDLSNPFPLIMRGKRQRVPFEYFINNDLKYLQGGVSTMTYTTNRVNSYAARITKMIADIEDRHHGPKHPSETIVFHNEDGNPARANIKQALGYRKDGDRDGKSEFLRCVKASANSDVKYSFTSAQDGEPLQDDVRLCLGNDLKKAQDHSQRHVSNLRNRTAYTAYSDPQGVIYKDPNNRNKLLGTDKLNKFSDGTLNYVRTALHDITSGIRMEYLPKRKWSGLDKRRARVMIQDI